MKLQSRPPIDQHRRVALLGCHCLACPAVPGAMPTEERRGHAVEQRTGLVVRMPTLLRDVGMAPG